MSPDPATDANPYPADRDADWARPVYERQIAMLGALAEAGLQMALLVRDEAKGAAQGDGPEVAATLEGLARAFGRASRAVRLTLLLQEQLVKQLKAHDHHQAYLATESARRRKASVQNIVERIAADEDGVEIENLVAEACERLDQEDLYGDVLEKPLSELVAMICQDLGLSPDWPRLAEEAWAREEIKSGQVGWPLTPPIARFCAEGRQDSRPASAIGLSPRPSG